jgi:beta-lactamase class A
MLTKRRFVIGALAAGSITLAPNGRARAATGAERLADELARIERESGGRLGVAVLDTGSKAQWGHRSDERFPMCSTFKLLAAAVLARVDAGKEQLTRRVRFATSDIVVNSPITKERAGEAGMSLDEICDAAMVVSDNTAGNLILQALGGPAALTDYARSLGDAVTRLDRIEPDLNEALPGDLRDTTSPAAMLSDLRTLALGNVLSPPCKDHLIGWLRGNKTGDTRLRAGLPKDWVVGDKTGAGEHGTTNDVGVIWPPSREPIIIAVYLTGASADAEGRNAALAAVGRAVATAVT